ncbi:MAG TPA: diadenylate cyclase CdaA [Clostridia bacterium]|nr:diadenylate cyclase CdaA [Clostridia bacterium]
MSYDEIANAIASGFGQFSFGDALDILIIAWLFYKLIVWTKETRAYQVLKGFAILYLSYFISQLLSLYTLSAILGAIVQSGLIVVVILFQPEIRRAFEHIGRGKLFDRSIWAGFASDQGEIVRELHKAVLSMARRHVGALIVIEQSVALGDIISTGTRIQGVVSGALLENIFEPNAQLHDGAVIIRNDTIIAAGCFLPLSDDMDIARELGTRHRAALGISSVSDSITLVVSEETGIISVAQDGKLVRYIDAKALKDLLDGIYQKERGTSFAWFARRIKNGEQ